MKLFFDLIYFKEAKPCIISLQKSSFFAQISCTMFFETVFFIVIFLVISDYLSSKWLISELSILRKPAKLHHLKIVILNDALSLKS